MMNADNGYQQRRLRIGKGLTNFTGVWCPLRGRTDEYALFRKLRWTFVEKDVVLPSEETKPAAMDV